MVKACIKDCHQAQIANTLWNGSIDIVVEKEHLIQGLAHVANAGRNFPCESIVCKHNYWHRWFTQVGWNLIVEEVVIYKQSI